MLSSCSPVIFMLQIDVTAKHHKDHFVRTIDRAHKLYRNGWICLRRISAPSKLGAEILMNAPRSLVAQADRHADVEDPFVERVDHPSGRFDQPRLLRGGEPEGYLC